MIYSEKIQADLKTAMKAGEKDKVRTFRGLLAKLKDKKIAKNDELDEKEEVQVLKKAAKERLDSFTTYEKAGRDDLASVEKLELDIIKAYLPEEMDEAAVKAIVADVIAKTGATGMQDMGKVMGAAMKAVNGQADGKVVQTLVKQMLG